MSGPGSSMWQGLSWRAPYAGHERQACGCCVRWVLDSVTLGSVGVACLRCRRRLRLGEFAFRFDGIRRQGEGARCCMGSTRPGESVFAHMVTEATYLCSRRHCARP